MPVIPVSQVKPSGGSGIERDLVRFHVSEVSEKHSQFRTFVALSFEQPRPPPATLILNRFLWLIPRKSNALLLGDSRRRLNIP